MDNVIAHDAAQSELDRIIAFWEVNPEGKDWEDSRKKLLAAIEKGRIVMDEQKGVVVMTLIAPIEKEGGGQITEFVLHEPTAADLRVMDKYEEKEQISKTIHLASRMVGLPVGITERMVSRDMSTMGAIASLFF